ncbi:hypothetical protein TNCV_2754031 [Trichonephila clavipes]|nr:hypothetical protein TNCV_2754031 [Trichonephila clavipes]
MSNGFVKVVRSVSFGSLSLTEIGFQYNHWSDPKYPLKYGVWTVLGRWNLLREGTIILLFAQLIYARDGQSHTCQGNKRQDYVQRPSENFHTNRFSENDLF